MWLLIGASVTLWPSGHSYHLLDPAVGQVDEVLALGAVPVTALLLPEVVAAVVVLDMAAIYTCTAGNIRQEEEAT